MKRRRQKERPALGWRSPPSIIARKGVSERISCTTTTTATVAIIERPMRFNEDLFRKETYCHGHWWAGDTCLYGAHSLIEEELLPPDPQVEERQQAVIEAEQIVKQVRAALHFAALSRLPSIYETQTGEF